MQTRVDEIAVGVYRLSTLVEMPPAGFTFNQYLIDADEPLLFHCGGRGLFPLVSEAAATIVPLYSDGEEKTSDRVEDHDRGIGEGPRRSVEQKRDDQDLEEVRPAGPQILQLL